MSSALMALAFRSDHCRISRGRGSIFKSAATPAPPLGSSPARSSARLGSSLHIKGHITGTEDLQIDGKVDGPISLRGHALTVGPAAQLTSEIHAREIVVFGKVVGNVHARDRVDVRDRASP